MSTAGDAPPPVSWARMSSLLAAFLRRDWKIAVSYRVGFAAQVGQSVTTVFFLFFLGKLVNSGRLTSGTLHHVPYFPFAVLGVALLGLVGAELGAVSTQIRTDQTTGTLEALLAMPPPPALTVLGSVVFQLLFATAIALLTVGVAVVGFGMRFHASAASALVGLAAVVASLVLFAAVGVGFASLVIVFKRGGQLSGFVTTAFSLLGGVYYPVSLLPTPLRVISDALPFAWALDVIRGGLLDHQLLWLKLLLTAGATVVAVPLSFAAFNRAVAHSRRAGTLGQY